MYEDMKIEKVTGGTGGCKIESNGWLYRMAKSMVNYKEEDT